MRHAALTIGAVADATGLSVDVLRSWETRYGFPAPERRPSGHRRYRDEHVAQIREVQRRRAAGLSLEAAIGQVAQAAPQQLSIFADLRRRWPHQPVQLLSKRALVALSRAIEDECLAQGERSILIGCFQRERYFRASEQRWIELCRTARWSAVFADFAATDTSTTPIEIAIGADQPLRREWAVVCDGPAMSVCLAAVERIDRPAGARRFETISTVEPAVVRDAVRIAVDLGARCLDAVPPVDTPAGGAPPDSTRLAVSLLHRTIAHLDR